MELTQIASNFVAIEFNGGIFYFSYRTCIAFHLNGKLTIRENDWSTTTGKHLNYICKDQSVRIAGTQFDEKLAAITAKITA